ncbi:ABC transporter permease subunit [Anaeromicropila herbilytica]|uniref:ABC transporter permease n=1 Tax=Anaeromicropila herbilytica TaxID=2785025 RepID=A0A7R7EHD4_9FIRM|nr:ABC transporter permease subunit [Anaeromicropila herbilytica]BCN28871.1 hypothetical protein bsdtb5_01660 [Anaeromicropila herbilytica]
MRTFIWFELKKRVRQAKTWGLIILLLMVSLLVIKNYKIKLEEINSNKGNYSIGDIFITEAKISKYNADDLHSKEHYIKTKYVYELLKKVGKQVKEAEKRNDRKEYNRAVTFGYLLLSKEAAQKEGSLRELSFRNSIEPIWNIVSEDVEYDSVNTEYANSYANRKMYFETLLSAKYYYALYQHNLKDSNEYQIDSLSFCYHYLNKIMPILLAVLVLIIMFDSVNEEHSKGSLKLVLTQPFSRIKYMISKIIVGFLHTVFVIVIPIIPIVSIMGLGDSFNNYNYPVLYLRHSFNSLFSIHNHLEYDIKHFGYNKYFGFSSASFYSKGEEGGVSNQITIMPLYQFLLLSFLILIFIILFYVVLNTLISCIFKSKIISFAVSGLITIVGMVLSNPFISSDNYNLSPFSMNNPVRILSGTYNVTALTAIAVLSICSVILFVVNVIYFRKKNL